MDAIKCKGEGNDFLKQLIDAKANFILKKTGYSIEIETGKRKYLFSKTSNSKKTFYAHSKIKADIVRSNVEIDAVPHHKIKFYDVRDFMENEIEFYLPEVFNVDIKNAYPQTLFNFGFISNETFEYINTEISKLDRLKAVGMIATNKIIYEFKKGECINSWQKNNKINRNIFKAVCYNVGDAMNKCGEYLDNSFLFYWVDGIYLTDPNKIDGTVQLLNQNNYKSSVERLSEFYAKLENDVIKIQFEKEGKKKLFNLPLNDRVNNIELMKINKLFNFKKIKPCS